MTTTHAFAAEGSTARPRQCLMAAALLVAAALSGCGGGGSDTGLSPFPWNNSGGGGSGGGGGSADAAAQVCSPNNPYRGDALAPTRVGSLSNEKAWLKSYMTDAYLWYNEMPAVNSDLSQYSDEMNVYKSLDNYFQDLKTPAITASGKKKDQFSFTYPTKAWQNLSQSGIEAGYGVQWYMAQSKPPRGLRVAYVENKSAAATGLQRGDVLVSADGVDADDSTSAGVHTLNAALFPTALGQSHTFVVQRGGVKSTHTLISANVTKTPVPLAQVITAANGKKIGYMIFNDHIATAEQQLIDAINTFKTAAINDLVIDMRYNGGGYLYIASELAYMIAGAGPTSGAGKFFERLQYNSKRLADTNSQDAVTPFYGARCLNQDCTQKEDLPALNLPRVSVLTTGGTCSASEAVINGLRGVGVDVRIIGSTTCGKPYGFTAKDNCGISYFPIEFKGVNAQGYGDYADGFAPTCAAADDMNHAQGDVAETQLATALNNLTTNGCGVAAGVAARPAARPAAEGVLLRGPEREAAIWVRPLR